MDAASLRARVEAGLTFRHPVGAHTFVVCLPTRQRHDQIVRESMGDDFGTTPASIGRYRVALVAEALRGWEGLRVRDVCPEHDEADNPLPFDAATARLLIDERPDLHDALYAEIGRRIDARGKALAADAGESRSGSPGSGGAPTSTTTAAQA